MLTRVQRGKVRRPRKTLLYGQHGSGKTTWAVKSCRPIFLCCEDGCGDLDVERTPLIRTFGEFNGWVSDLITQPHDYGNVVVDTVDWLEPMLHKAVCERAGKQNIEDFGYGKGYVHAMAAWEYVLSSLDSLVRDRQMGVILLAHAAITNFKDPSTESYNRYEPALQKLASERLQEWCDEVFFCKIRVATVKQDEGFNRTRTRGVGMGERVMYTNEEPSHLAKRRIPMADVLPLDYAHYEAAIREAYSTGNIAGIVTDGSSKQKPQPETESAA